MKVYWYSINSVTTMVVTTVKNKMLKWTPQCEEAFQHFNSIFTEGPIFAHFDVIRSISIETDARVLPSGAILSQLCEDN